ncbi:flagellar alpha dynein [Microcoleus sp. BROC3]|uniref:flagellar alpha dynein n=1 Tax=Microcoleus sp. BROC3 TaxID=3055323 RepID=UPI002FD532DB
MTQLHERNGDLGLEVQDLQEELRKERADREADKKSAPAGKDFPDVADLLNQLKAKRKKSKTDLADLEAILEILEG